MTPSRTLTRVVSGALCSGCGACAAIAPGAVAMTEAEPGFLRPRQTADLSDAQETRIKAACPGVGLTQDPAGRQEHPLWGPLTGLRSGHATDAVLRHRASSGGALSALLVHLVRSGFVDRVLQTAAAPGFVIGNATVLNATPDGIAAAAGSRYAPSAPLDGVERHLAGDGRIAFVGKPCDVAALRAMSRSDPRVAIRFPVMVSFFCAGVPSHTGAREILARLGVAESDVAGFRFRGDGWPGHAAATLHDGSVHKMTYADSWGGILSRHVQFRCKICPDGTGGFADIVCADAWETDAKGYPLFAEREGESLIVSRTALGERLVTDAIAAGEISAEPFDADRIRAIQPGQTQRRQFTLPRLIALKLARRPSPAYRGFHLVRNAREGGMVAFARNLLGTLRRIAQDRL